MSDPTESGQIRPLEVSDRQSIAIDALIAGSTHREAAEKAGVQRTTVTEWCNKNIIFIAEWNRRRKQRLAAAGERLHEVTVAALDAVMESIRDGDIAAALALIRIVGVEHLVRAAQPGPTTPMGVHQNLAANLRSDLFGEMFVSEEISWMVERDSEASADWPSLARQINHSYWRLSWWWLPSGLSGHSGLPWWRISDAEFRQSSFVCVRRPARSGRQPRLRYWRCDPTPSDAGCRYR